MANDDTEEDPEAGSKERNARMTELPDEEKPPQARSDGVDDGDGEDDQSPTGEEERRDVAREPVLRADETLDGVVGLVTRVDGQGNPHGEAWVEWRDDDIEDALFRSCIDALNQKEDPASLPDRTVVDVTAHVTFTFDTGEQ